MEKLTIALDWTANTNHTGFYVAQVKGFYAALGLEVDLTTPAKKVEFGLINMVLLRIGAFWKK